MPRKRSRRWKRLVRSARIASGGLLTLLLAIATSGVATAQVALDSSDLPPESEPPDCEQVVTQYVGVDVHALFPSGIDFSNARHYCFQNVAIEPNPLNGDEHEFFDSKVQGTFDAGNGPQIVELQGPVGVQSTFRDAAADAGRDRAEPLAGAAARHRQDLQAVCVGEFGQVPCRDVIGAVHAAEARHWIDGVADRCDVQVQHRVVARSDETHAEIGDAAPGLLILEVVGTQGVEDAGRFGRWCHP